MPIVGTGTTYNGTDANEVILGTFDQVDVNGNRIGDRLYGNGGIDEMHGRFGDDYMNGGDGADKIWGDAGNDRLVGGSGNDQFNFAWQMGRDTIEDFKVTGVNSSSETDSTHTYDLYSEGHWFTTQATWLAPQDVNGDGRLDAVLQLWSPEWISYANETHWRNFNADGQLGTADDYTQSNMTDTVTSLGWGGDVNGNRTADYLEINIQHHTHTADLNSGYMFA